MRDDVCFYQFLPYDFKRQVCFSFNEKLVDISHIECTSIR
jgi:hypothetical protein